MDTQIIVTHMYKLLTKLNLNVSLTVLFFHIFWCLIPVRNGTPIIRQSPQNYRLLFHDKIFPKMSFELLKFRSSASYGCHIYCGYTVVVHRRRRIEIAFILFDESFAEDSFAFRIIEKKLHCVKS